MGGMGGMGGGSALSTVVADICLKCSLVCSREAYGRSHLLSCDDEAAL